MNLLLAIAQTLAVAVAFGVCALGVWAIVTGQPLYLQSPEHGREHEPADDDRPEVDQGDGDGEDRVSPPPRRLDPGDGRALDDGGEDGLGEGSHAATIPDEPARVEDTASPVTGAPERHEPAPPEEDGLGPSDTERAGTTSAGAEEVAEADPTDTGDSSSPPTAGSDHAGSEEPPPPTPPRDEEPPTEQA